MDRFPELDVSRWQSLEVEPRGGKPDKLWLIDHEERRWLLKPVTFHTHRGQLVAKGDDWAEKLAAEIAVVLGVPGAHVELAVRGETLGIVSADVTSGAQLVPGNEVLHGRSPDYPQSRGGEVPGYTFLAVAEALRARMVAPPPGAASGLNAVESFAGYLLLDAVIGNTDRHHENWGLLVDATGIDRLAPSFDHATSLGFQLTDEDRERRCLTADRNHTPEAWARRARCRPMEGRPNLVRLALNSLATLRPEVRQHYRSKLEQLTDDVLESLVVGVTGSRMSQVARIFARRMVSQNRTRMINGIDRRR